jgi:hypothetical protein
MSNQIAAGSTLKLSAGVPATFDASGYNALSFTSIGDVLDIGEFGAEWAIDNKNPLAIRGTIKKKTSRDPGGFSAALALDTDDAGQIIMKAARDSDSLYSVLITTPEGDKYYCQVLVTTFKVGAMSQSGKMMASSNCAVSTSSTDVDWVEVLAA